MLTYIITFYIVIILSFITSIISKKNKIISSSLSLISILLLSFIAGWRAYTVGTDLHVYGLEYYHQGETFQSLFELLKFHHFKEPLYFAMNYIVAKKIHSMQFFLFFHQFIISTIVFKIAYDDKKKGSFLFYIIAYIFLWYNTSFNIIRQSLGLFIALYSFKYIEQKRYLKYMIAISIAALFHQSVLVCMIYPIISYIAKKDKKFKILITVSILLFISFNFIKGFAPNLIELFPSFSKYFKYLLRQETNFIPRFGIVKLIFVLVVISFSKSLIKTDENNRVFVYFAVFDILFYYSSIFIMYGYRASYLFILYYIYLIPRIDKILKNKKNSAFFRVMIFLTLFLYWYFRYINIGYDGTYPYTFFQP